MTEPGHDELGEVRAELREWLESNWDPDLSLLEWRNRLARSGWACPAWPLDWCGRGLPGPIASAVADELHRAGAPGVPDGVGMHLAAPTILEHASDDLKRRFLAPTVTGEIAWCQLFSEPGAGSDLAGLTTRARLDGDEWTVRGQKVWNTSAHHADFGLLLARTDWDQPKHSGITYFILPMHQSAVEVRPLRQMNGHASFNEVFLDDAKIPVGNVIGRVGDGWAVALTTLAYERRLTSLRASLPHAERPGRALSEAADEQAVAFEPYRWYPQRAGRVDLVVDHAVSTGRSGDAVVRQEIASVVTMARVAELTARRAASARARGRPPGPEGSLGKLAGSAIARAAAGVHTSIAGAAALLSGPESALGGVVAEILVSVPAASIAGGTDEVQRSILAERMLGLPKEPAVDRDLPFRSVRTNLARQPSRPEATDADH